MSQEIYTGKEFKKNKIEFKITKDDEIKLDWYTVSVFAEGA
ncbi:hypothetical protein [Caldisphaera lagunensis]|nr:hypothetical protein [Caldisphaera lagunensis]